jgi:hypothetical protein
VFLSQLFIRMNGCDYYLYDQIVYALKDGRIFRIDRSKLPRWFPGPIPDGITREQQIEETEDLVTRVLFESGTWNVSADSGDYYRDEFLALGGGMDFGDVRKVTREIVFKMR